ncbi:fused MFS/spermidine synthase, partial [Oligoflexia bacterium]|nr:fused MFS/spermidine synthase [Oligoflexia bacterium]
AVVMILELTGVRLFAPFLGTSIFVWTSLIGVILASLSVGYWWGGAVADRNPSARRLAIIILAAAVLIAAVPIVNEFILVWIRRVVTDVRIASVSAAILLFAPATILLGMVAPFAVRLRILEVAQAGRTVGRLYAWSAVGSIVGTFMAGFVLFAYIGTLKIFFILSILLVVASALTCVEKLIKEQLFLICILGAGFVVQQMLLKEQAQNGIIDVDTRYSRVRIVDRVEQESGRTARLLLNGVCGVQGGIYLDQFRDAGNVPLDVDPFAKLEGQLHGSAERAAFRYFEFFRLNEHFQPTQTRALVIGGGAYVYPRSLLERFPDAGIDVLEIDPQLTALAEQYFYLKPDSRLNIINVDGRVFLNGAQAEAYDSVVIDAFNANCAVPFHLASVEAVSKVHHVLKNGGVVLVNLISALEGQKGRFFQAAYATYKKIFPQVYAFAMDSPELATKKQNIFIVALKSQQVPDFVSDDILMNEYLRHLWKGEVSEDVVILTDDFAPVDYYVSEWVLPS